MTRVLWSMAGLLLLAALAVSAYTYGTLPRYQVMDGEYLKNTEFELPGADWGFDLAGEQAPTAWFIHVPSGDIRFETGLAIIENTEPGRRVMLYQQLELAEQRQFELSARIETAAVVGGDKPWHVARVDFAGLLADGTRDHQRRHVLFDGTGTQPSQLVKGFFELDPELEVAQLSLQLTRSTGRLVVSDLSLKPAAHDPVFVAMDGYARVTWAVFLVAVAAIFWRGAAHRPAAAGAILLVAMGAAVVLLPGGFREWLAESFTVGGGSEWTPRAVHFIAFAAIGFLISLARRRERPKQVFPYLLVMAVGAEALQIVSGGLGLDDLFDLLINIAGVAVGSGMAEEHIKAKYGRRRRRRRQKAEPEVMEGEYRLKGA